MPISLSLSRAGTATTPSCARHINALRVLARPGGRRHRAELRQPHGACLAATSTHSRSAGAGLGEAVAQLCGSYKRQAGGTGAAMLVAFLGPLAAPGLGEAPPARPHAKPVLNQAISLLGAGLASMLATTDKSPLTSRDTSSKTRGKP